MPGKITVPALRGRKATRGQGDKLAMVTAYDVTFARLFDSAGVDAMLVGDSLGMVIQGYTSTLAVTLDEVIYHTRAVARGTANAHIIGDMPFMSYQTSLDEGLRNAGRLMKEGGAESVKVEGGKELGELVHRMVRTGIPVMGHVGLLPQRVHAMGGFKVQGRDDEAAESILEDAMVLAEAGCYAVVIEGVPAPLAERITHAIDVPTIGIGAGVGCDGQILVGYDLLGLNNAMKPRFVKHFANFYDDGLSAARAYIDEVRGGVFPGAEHSFGLRPAAPRAEPARTDAPLTASTPAYGPTH